MNTAITESTTSARIANLRRLGLGRGGSGFGSVSSRSFWLLTVAAHFGVRVRRLSDGSRLFLLWSLFRRQAALVWIPQAVTDAKSGGFTAAKFSGLVRLDRSIC